ncbi:hypothetical protein D3C72_1987740 [compost metagenome]
MELDAGAQLDRVGLAVVADFGKGRGQKRRRLPILVEGIERLEHVLRDDADQIGRGGHRVECRRFADRGDVDDATLFLREGE